MLITFAKCLKKYYKMTLIVEYREKHIMKVWIDWQQLSFKVGRSTTSIGVMHRMGVGERLWLAIDFGYLVLVANYFALQLVK